MRSVAIIGFSELTLPYLKEVKADENWTMNHVIFVKEHIRFDRLFEMHHRSWYLRGELDKSKKYNRWLRKEHTFPIYMQEEELNKELIPSGVRYPLEEICDELLPGLLKFNGTGNIRQKYFTSSASFMIALAIYEKFERIYLIGIDMENDTEWGYQKPNGEFWIGVALGRGIEVLAPEPSPLFTAPIYGYEVVPYIDKLHVKTIIENYQKKHIELKEIMTRDALEVEKDPDNLDATDKYIESSSWVYMYEGAITAGSRLMNIKDNYISRQFIELKKGDYNKNMEENKAFCNVAKGQIDLVGRDKVPDEVWRAYLTARANLYANLGAFQLHRKLMNVIDFRPVSMELTKELIED